MLRLCALFTLLCPSRIFDVPEPSSLLGVCFG